MVCPKFNSNVHKLKRPQGSLGAHLFLFWDYERGVSIGELPKFSKFFDDGPINMAPSIKKKRERKL
jgi:hypothetical protein